MVETGEQYLYLLKRIGRWPDEKLINYMLKKFTFTYQLNQAVCFVYDEAEKCFKALQALGSATHEERNAALQKIDSQTRVQKAEDALDALLEDYDPNSDRTLNEKLRGFSISAEKDSLLKRELLEKKVSTCLNNNNPDPEVLTEEDRKFFEKMGTYKFIAIPLRGHEEKLIGFVYGNNVLTGEPIGGQRDDFKMNIALSAGSIVVQKILGEETIRRHEQERLRLEDEKRRNEELAVIGQAAAEIAHDTKGPVITMGLTARQIKKQVRDPSKAEDIIKNADLIIELASELEERIGTDLMYAGQREAMPEKINICEICDKAIARLRKGGMKIEIDYESDKALAYADPMQIKAAYSNLIRNAFEAMENDKKPDNKLVIKIGADEKTAYASFTNPQKIPDEKMEKLFVPFFTTKKTGTGLGLVIVKKFVEANKGSIECASSEKDGTTFKVVLPAYTNQNGNE
jgi:signal transduction histidine kinase